MTRASRFAAVLLGAAAIVPVLRTAASADIEANPACGGLTFNEIKANTAGNPNAEGEAAKAASRTGLQAEKTGDYSVSLGCYSVAAKLNDKIGEALLARLYMAGKGVPKDTDEAIHWARLSAEQGFEVGEYLYGFLLLGRNASPQDRTDAESWLAKAAAQGNGDAKELLTAAKKEDREHATAASGHLLTGSTPSDALIVSLYKRYWENMADHIANSTVSSVAQGSHDATGIPASTGGSSGQRQKEEMDEIGKIFGLDKVMKGKADQMRAMTASQIVTVASKRKHEGSWVIYVRVRQRGDDHANTHRMILTPHGDSWEVSMPELGAAPAFFGVKS